MSNQDVITDICLLKGNDVARMLNISRAFAYQLMRQGEIPTVRIGNAVRVRKEAAPVSRQTAKPSARPGCARCSTRPGRAGTTQAAR